MTLKKEAWAASILLTTVVIAVFFYLQPDALSSDFSTRIGGGFHPGHAWAMDRISQMLWADAPWSGDATPMAYPDTGHVRLIGWGALLFGAIFSPLIGLLPAYQLAWVLNILLSAWLSTALIRRVTQAPWMAAAGASLVYALGPMALGFMANGQLAKLHMWCLPLLLIFSDMALQEKRKMWTLAAVGLAAALTGFSSPSIALLVPFVLACWVWFRSSAPHRWRWMFTVLAIAAIGLILPMLYHQMPGDGTAVLRPAAPIPGLAHPPWLSPVARPAELFLGHAPWSSATDGVNNVSYLGIPALLAGAFVARKSAGRALGLSLTILGIVLALGPAIDGDGVRWVMPAMVLEWAEYPIVQSGMYYRFSQVAALGLALLIARGLRQPGGRRIAWAIGVINIGAGLWATEALWPRPMQPFAGTAIYAEMAADPVPGAVLDLPLETIDTDGSKAALAQALHGRHSTALVHNITVESSPRLKRIDGLLSQRDLSKTLQEAGFRYVVLRPARGQGIDKKLAQRLTGALGTPQVDQAVHVWTIPSR